MLTACGNHAQVWQRPVEPALDAQQASAAVAAIDKLLQQFQREGAISSGECAVDADGHLLVVAWEGDLSGCRKDKLAKVVAHIEATAGVTILDAPPMVVQIAGSWRVCDRPALRRAVEAGIDDGASRVWNTRAEQLGELRTAPSQPLADSWLAPLVARWRQG